MSEALKVKMDFSGWRESRRNSPRQVGSCKSMCCVLRMPGSFYEEKGESGKVGGAIVRYLSRRPLSGPNLFILLPPSTLILANKQCSESLKTSFLEAGVAARAQQASLGTLLYPRSWAEGLD